MFQNTLLGLGALHRSCALFIWRTMRLVSWLDGRKTKRWSWIRDEDPDDLAPQGIPVEIPDLDRIDWDGLKNEIRDALESHGLFSWQDIQKSQLGFAPAITILKRHLTRLYRES
jgi:hypothetical protein